MGKPHKRSGLARSGFARSGFACAVLGLGVVAAPPPPARTFACATTPAPASASPSPIPTGQLGQRRLVELQGQRLRDAFARTARGPILLYLRDGRARRRMEGQGLHVHARPRIPHRRPGGLFRARLRSHRVFRSRHRQGRQELDGSIDRSSEPARVTAERPVTNWPKRRPNRLHASEGMRASRRRCKIIATLGPASADRGTIAALLRAGADVFRINMSHASHDAMRERVAMIRAVEEESGAPIGVLVDLQGPKLRLGIFAGRRRRSAQGRRLRLRLSDPDARRRNAGLSSASGNSASLAAGPCAS